MRYRYWFYLWSDFIQPYSEVACLFTQRYASTISLASLGRGSSSSSIDSMSLWVICVFLLAVRKWRLVFRFCSSLQYPHFHPCLASQLTYSLFWLFCKHFGKTSVSVKYRTKANVKFNVIFKQLLLSRVRQQRRESSPKQLACTRWHCHLQIMIYYKIYNECARLYNYWNTHK